MIVVNTDKYDIELLEKQVRDKIKSIFEKERTLTQQLYEEDMDICFR